MLINVQLLKEIHSLQGTQIKFCLLIQDGLKMEIFNLNYHMLLHRHSKRLSYFKNLAMLFLAVESLMFKTQKFMMMGRVQR